MNPLTRNVVDTLSEVDDATVAEAVRALDDQNLAELARSSTEAGVRILIALLTDELFVEVEGPDAGPPPSEDQDTRPTAALRGAVADPGGASGSVLAALQAAGGSGLARREIVARTGLAPSTVAFHVRALSDGGSIVAKGRARAARWYALT